jgi:hypothetical protein
MNELRVVWLYLTPAYVQERGVCDDEETSCAFTHPTIPASIEGLARYPMTWDTYIHQCMVRVPDTQLPAVTWLLQARLVCAIPTSTLKPMGGMVSACAIGVHNSGLRCGACC